jgi:IclR family acetate operon transcriptional repressor
LDTIDSVSSNGLFSAVTTEEKGAIMKGTIGPIDGAQTLAKGLMLLELVADRQGDRGVGLGQLTRELGWNKSTIHRLMATLVALGYAQQNSHDGLYRLGLKAFHLGAAYSRDLDLQQAATPALQEAMDETELGSSLVVLDMTSREVIFIDRVDSAHPLRMHINIGERFPWNCTAAGKAIAAFLPGVKAKALLSGPFPTRTSASIRSATTLHEQFSLIRAVGYATDDGENSDGVRCVAAPIFDALSQPIAAISLSGYTGQVPVERFTELGETVRQTAGRVSRRLGYQGEQNKSKGR